MLSTNIHQIKAALWKQAFIGDTWVSCPMGRVVAIRRRKGQLQAMIRGWGRWYPVEHVFIEGSLLMLAAAKVRSSIAIHARLNEHENC